MQIHTHPPAATDNAFMNLIWVLPVSLKMYQNLLKGSLMHVCTVTRPGTTALQSQETHLDCQLVCSKMQFAHLWIPDFKRPQVKWEVHAVKLSLQIKQ